MQKIKDKSRSEAKTQSQSPERGEGEAWGKKIKVRHLQTIFNIFFVKSIFMIIFHNVLNLLSLTFYLLSFLKFMNGEALNEVN